MSNFSNYLEQKILGVTLLGSPFTAPSTVYLSLGTTIASDGDFYTEVATGIGYGRLPIQFSDPTSLNDSTVVNSSSVLFSLSTSPWGEVRHFAIFDSEAVGSGNMLYYGVMLPIRDVQASQQLEFQAGELSVLVD